MQIDCLTNRHERYVTGLEFEVPNRSSEVGRANDYSFEPDLPFI